MIVKILVTAKYTEFETGLRGAVKYEAGDIVTFPDDYGQGLVDAGLAEPVEPNITSSALKMAREFGLHVGSIEGSGQDGRVILADVHRARKG